MYLKIIKSGLLVFVSIFLLLNCAPSYDVVILDGMVVDGTGRPPFQADVGISNQEIKSIGNLKPSQGEQTIYAKGKYVVPGFIDIHPHHYSQGIEFMWINGEMVIQKGEFTGVLAGKPLRASRNK